MPSSRYQVRLTQGAENDFESIITYVAVHGSPARAEALLGKFLERIDTLEQFPERGSVPRELEALGIGEFRQILLSPYRMIYRIASNKVFVSVIADGRRDMQALLERRLFGREG